MNKYLLMKFGRREHLESLQKRGVVYMNHTDYFRKEVDESLRGDVNEGLVESFQVNYLKIGSGDKSIVYNGKNFEAEYCERENGNIFSMYAFAYESIDTTKELSIDIDVKNGEFGDCVLLILNKQIFLDKVENSLREGGYTFRRDFVKYYASASKPEKLSVFHKPDSYAYQNEYRIFVDRSDTSPLRIEIGSIESISEIYDIESLERL